METQNEKNSPLMQQYFDIKSQHSDTLLLFQVGDFYELFFDDAKIASAHLAITLTSRGKNRGEDIPLCGIPVHALNHYLTKLIKGGFRVALCEQLTKPQPGTVVQRGVTRVFSPATLTEASMLDEKSASYLLSFVPGKNEWGLVFGELLTAQLFATTVPTEAIRMVEAELIRFFPDEVLLGADLHAGIFTTFFKKLGYYTTVLNTSSDTQIMTDSQYWIESTFCKKSRSVFEQHETLTGNLTILYHYLKRTDNAALSQFKTIQFYEPDDYLILDSSTQKNLELIKNSQDSGRKNTLLSMLDHAKTPMGSRTIKKWVCRPLVQKAGIEQRLDVVGGLVSNIGLFQQLEKQLNSIADLERIIGRISLRRATINDYTALKQSLHVVPEIKKTIEPLLTIQLANTIYHNIADFTSLTDLLDCSINDDPEIEHPIKRGYDLELDHLANLLANGQQEILKLEQQEIARTGITSLKIGFNNISGYYIEITNTHSEKIPADYRHQQTLASRKRFTTPELKNFEADVFKAQNQFAQIQDAVFGRVKDEVATYIPQLRHCAHAVAHLDALFGFAHAAYNYRYTRPTWNDQRIITMTEARHPVVEQNLDGQFTPNDIRLTDDASTWIITGPNMGGKSTYLRQTALLCIMAQCGSFVPATTANMPILDRIFTRIGSADNVAEGKSTFLVEMEETATICTQATANSLVILDEVGRGTSTYDGIAL